MTLKLYFIEKELADEIMAKYKEPEELNELTINGKTYSVLECDFSLDDYKPFYIESDKCFDELREASEVNYEVYTL